MSHTPSARGVATIPNTRHSPARKRAAREYYLATGEALPSSIDYQLKAKLSAASSVRQSMPIRLLDVGSCGFPFEGADGIECTAIDLCPQDGNKRVLQCDFLGLAIGPPGSAMRVEPAA